MKCAIIYVEKMSVYLVSNLYFDLKEDVLSSNFVYRNVLNLSFAHGACLCLYYFVCLCVCVCVCVCVNIFVFFSDLYQKLNCLCSRASYCLLFSSHDRSVDWQP